MKFRTSVEPVAPMKGLEIPPEVVEALGGGKRPAPCPKCAGRQEHTGRGHSALG